MVFSLTDLVSQVRQRSNIVGSTHITDTEIKLCLNGSLAALYGKITGLFEDYNVSEVTFTLTSASDGYNLDSMADFYKILRLDRAYSGSFSSNDWYDLKRMNLRDEAVWNGAARSGNCSEVVGYIMRGNKLKVVPQAQSAGTYRMLYYPAWIDLTDDDLVKIGPPGQHWEEWALLDTCIKLFVKEESDPGNFAVQKQMIDELITKEASNRDAGQAEPPPMSAPNWYDGQSRFDRWY